MYLIFLFGLFKLSLASFAAKPPIGETSRWPTLNWGPGYFSTCTLHLQPPVSGHAYYALLAALIVTV